MSGIIRTIGLAIGLLPLAAQATHFRFGHLSWKPTGGTSIEVRYQNAWRLNAYTTANGRCLNPATLTSIPCTGPGGVAGVDDIIVEFQGGTSLNWGDGSPPVTSPRGSLLYKVTAIDPVDNWLFGEALDPANLPAVSTAISHTYAAPGHYTVASQSCCRISAVDGPNTHVNNPDGFYRVETTVEAGGANVSPVATNAAPIVKCPIDQVCTFPIRAGDDNREALTFRMSTSNEAAGLFPIPLQFTQPGPPFAPNAATIDTIDPQTGEYRWDTTGAKFTGLVAGSLADSTNTCFNIIPFFTGADCSYAATRYPALASWIGPALAGGFYPLFGPARSLDFVPSPDDGRIAVPMRGTADVDDNGTPDDGTDDLVSANWTFGSAVHNALTGQNDRAIETWSLFMHTMPPTPVSSATANANGGFDYVIGSRGTPTPRPGPLAGVGDNAGIFPSRLAPPVPVAPMSPAWESTGSTDLSLGQRIGIERSLGYGNTDGTTSGLQPNVGAQTTGEFVNYTCLDNPGDNDCSTSDFLFGSGSSRLLNENGTTLSGDGTETQAGDCNDGIDNDGAQGIDSADPDCAPRTGPPGFDNLVLTFSTDGHGVVTDALAYWTREWSLKTGPQIGTDLPSGATRYSTDNSWIGGTFSFAGGTNILYSTQVMIEDGSSHVPLDFLIQLVDPDPDPPAFDDPALCTTTQVATVNRTRQFDVIASDPNPGDQVSLNAVSLPLGATMSPPLPVSGNPVASTFSWTPDGSQLGVHAVGFQATSSGTGVGFTTCGTIIEVVENQPPRCDRATPTTSKLWPPDHAFRTVSIGGVSDPDGDPVTVTIDSIFQDERVNGRGDGNTTPDGKGVRTSAAQLRAERSGTPRAPGNGRVYHIGFTASDGRGESCRGTVKVCVPHDQSSETCIDGGPLFDSTSLAR